jgi:hypothetical protein
MNLPDGPDALYEAENMEDAPMLFSCGDVDPEDDGDGTGQLTVLYSIVELS